MTHVLADFYTQCTRSWAFCYSHIYHSHYFTLSFMLKLNQYDLDLPLYLCNKIASNYL